MEKSRARLLLVLTNSSKEPFETTRPATNYNRIVAVAADGAEVEMFSSRRFSPGKGIVTVPPGESMTWEIEILPLLESFGVDMSSPCRIYWKVGNVRSSSMLLASLASPTLPAAVAE